MSDNPVRLLDGDSGVVRGIAWKFGDAAVQAEHLSSRIERIGGATGPQVWEGLAAEAFRQMLDSLKPEVIRFACSHRAAEDALRTYAAALDVAQRQAQDAHGSAGRWIKERESAECLAQQAASEAANHDTRARIYADNAREATARKLLHLFDPGYCAELDRYIAEMERGRCHEAARAADARHRQLAARSVQSTAQAQVNAAEMLGAQAAQLRDDAARRAASRLEDAATPGPSIWKQIGSVALLPFKIREAILDFFERHLQAIDDLSTALSVLAIVLAFVPGVGQVAAAVVGTVALGLAVFQLALTLRAVTKGRKDLSDLAKAALGVVPGVKIVKAFPRLAAKLDDSAAVWRKGPFRGFFNVDKPWDDMVATLPRPAKYFAWGAETASTVALAGDVFDLGKRWSRALVRPIPVLAPACSPSLER